MATQTFTALYNDPASAETAMERLRALGIPRRSLEIHRAGEGDVVPGNVPSGGLFALGDPLGGAERADEIAAGGTVVVARLVPEELVAEAGDILEEDAIEVDRDRG